jgi:hypothetical protein
VIVNYFVRSEVSHPDQRETGRPEGAWPVVEPALGDFGIFGARASAG